MLLVHHGGMCCGIKTIHGLGYDPDKTLHSLEAIKPEDTKRNYDAHGMNVNAHMPMFDEAAPEESGRDRLKRYIEFVRKHRPQHMIEVVTATVDGDSEFSQDEWHPILSSHGFKEVTTFRNSNSGNICHVWHLTIGQ